ncbi:UDP-phosphate galactose phosphotransferase [Bacillus thuringiensis]|uniref:sugar transferase n=1 Tax=Bacillus thuringiensis TaxID=1428 RepID=UPI000BEE2AA1|nr:sugar transferase [Bacillus thuringiensis]PEA14533.1 UDP-phosphate galactose phosphotransferase [Bacillus thuringiensis]PEF08161.1 UDP-phosphate galactose phosphotransferase [Bacillus thuringiensis]PFI28375.1 UDP-phosphate galactose phosphotransferase [Bacillus thuringiensis]PFP81884.1 UDP-phosphate galactose phosphotransferase [Bacillus thuringiensis]
MYNVIKRILGFIFSLMLMPFILLLIIIVGIAIKVEDRGPIFYFADRIGRDGKIFKMFKFRSMKVNAPDIRLEDGSTYNSDNDERVTKVGKFLRKTSIDEIPQAINILKGDMAFVGPRPDSAMWLNNYTKEERAILKVRPGITGYNQAINRNSVGTKEKIKNDIIYVQNISFLFDIKILILTVKSVLLSKNIYREGKSDIDTKEINDEMK